MATKKSTEAPAKTATKSPAKTTTKTAAKSDAKAESKPAASSAKAVKPAEKREPTHAEISHLAHQYWKERGHGHGSHDDDWARAEKELKSR